MLEDLSIIGNWAQDWLMLLSVNTLLYMTTKRNPLVTAYQLINQTLHQVTKAKYLGVTFNQTLFWYDNINNICNKANSTCGFLQRNLRNCSPHIKAHAYCTYVTGFAIWGLPHTST